MYYIAIDKTITKSIYLQIVDSIESAILRYELPNLYQLPTEKEIADFYEISIGIVKKAFEELEKGGLVVRFKGKGSFVNYRSIHRFNPSALRLETLYDIPYKTVYKAKLKASKQSERIKALFGGQEVLHVKRVFNDGHYPFILEESYLRVITKKQSIQETLSVSTMIKRFYVGKLSTQKNQMYAEAADVSIAKLFMIREMDPVTRFESVFYDKQENVLAMIDRTLPSDYVVFESEIHND